MFSKICILKIGCVLAFINPCREELLDLGATYKPLARNPSTFKEAREFTIVWVTLW
jgi:hypothetical protein